MQPGQRAPDADADPQGSTLPYIHCDPIASLGPTSIEVSYLGRDWTVPAMSAADWLRIVWADDFDTDRIFPGLLGAETAFFNALYDGEVQYEEALAVATEILEAASGYKWWFTLRMTSIMRHGWPRIGGMLNLDLSKVSLGMAITSALGRLIDNMEPAKIIDLVRELNEVPIEHRTEADDEQDVADFFAAMNQPL